LYEANGSGVREQAASLPGGEPQTLKSSVFPSVMRGLDPRIHRLGKKILAKMMDRPGQARR
jgi:hypothetical protein